ncbi:MAG: aryldialkylphosphatase [Gammaproteobacteria bacterium]|nr:aryldialkylphosphatase [Gammaproteobacteria bacterium]
MRRNALVCVLGASLALGLMAGASARKLERTPVPDLSGKVLTVNGPIDPAQLGETLVHEHIFINFKASPPMVPPPTSITVIEPPSAERKKNLFQLTDFDESLDAIMQFKRAGGSSIVDLSNFGLARDPVALLLVARASGLNVVMGSGWYMKQMHPPDMDRLSLEQLTDIIVRDITVGAQGTHIRSGIVGEVGVVGKPLTDNEKKSIRAAARAARITGAPMNIHNFEPIEEMRIVLDIIESEGVALNRVAMSHIGINPDGTWDPAIHELAFGRGTYVEWDYFGQAPLPAEMDAKRIDSILAAIQAGRTSQILLSHDICSQAQLQVNGGGGYTYIKNVIIPGLKARGVSDATIHQIMVENPRRLLAFVAPQAPIGQPRGPAR